MTMADNNQLKKTSTTSDAVAAEERGTSIWVAGDEHY